MVQILPERTPWTMAARSRFVAAIHRTSTSMVRVPPTRSKVRSWMTRNSFAWSSVLSSPISSKNRDPPSASSSRPRRAATAPVNAPFSWPKTSLSMSVSEIAAQLTGTNGPRALGLRS